MSVLNEILTHKKQEVKELYQGFAFEGLLEMAGAMPAPRSLAKALKRQNRHNIIAEIKRASPSRGAIRPNLNAAATAGAYEENGAAALSVLTDQRFFQGSIQDLREARQACSLPILRKDFIIDEIQLLEARIMGADAVLIIVAALGRERLYTLYSRAKELGLDVLLEIHNQEELKIALELEPEIIGINNRDLKAMHVDLDTCLRLRPLIPPKILVVAESGINSREDLKHLSAGGMDAFLIGSSLMSRGEPGRALRSLFAPGETS